MKEMRRVLALLLCFVMLVGYVPAGAFAAEAETVPAVEETLAAETTSAAEETEEAVTEPQESEPEVTDAAKEPIQIGWINEEAVSGDVSYTDVVDAAIIYSDLHAQDDDDYKQSTLKGVLSAIAADVGAVSSVTSAGDAFAVNYDSGNSGYNKFTGKTSILTGYVKEIFGSVAVNYVWSDHDRYAVQADGTTLLDKTSRFVYGAGKDGTYGTGDDDNYYIYLLSMADLGTNDRYRAGFHSNSQVTEAISAFSATAATLKKDRPLFVISHMPLYHDRKDNGHAYEWCTAINTVADTMDVAYFFGHNHNYDDVADYLYEKGTTLDICTSGNGSTGTSTPVEIKFTHINAGYMSPTTSNSSTRKGTAVVAVIYKDSVQYVTYNNTGVYDSGVAPLNHTVQRKVVTPTVNTVTRDGVTATALGLTDLTVTVDGETNIAQFGGNYYEVLNVDLEGYTSGDVTYSIEVQPDDGITADDLTLFYVNADGSLEELTFTSEEKDDVIVLNFTAAKEGTFAFGVLAETIPEGAVLSELAISGPEKTKYFLSTDLESGNVYLDITGLHVTARYTHEDQTYEKTLEWNRFDETVDGYSLSFDDMTTKGKKTVTVSYGDQAKTFTIWVCEDELDVGDIHVSFDTAIVTDLAIETVEVTETITTALEGLLTGNLVAYNFTPIYANGNTKLEGTATITMPVPGGVEIPSVYFVSDDGARVESLPTVLNTDGTLTFTTTHFSTFVVGDSTEIEVPDPNENTFDDVTTTIPGETKVYYVLDTDGLDVGETYLIVSRNSNGDGYALNKSPGRTSVTVSSGNVDGNTGNETYITGSHAEEEWTVASSGSGYTFKNGNNYLQNDDGTLQVSTTSTVWTWNNNYNQLSNVVEGSGWFGSDTTYYLYYRNTGSSSNRRFALTTTANSVYLYKRIEVDTTTTETVKGGTYSVVGNPATINNRSAVTGDTATLGSTVNFVANGSTTPVDITNATVTYAEVENGDPNGVISISGNTVTFSGNSGTALVKVTATGYHNNDTSKPYEVYNYIKITAQKRIYALTINLTEGETTTPAGDTMAVGQSKKLDLSQTALTYVDANGVTQTVSGVAWSVPEDMQDLVTIENGVFSFKEGAIGKDVVITATATYNGTAYTDTLTVSVQDAVWELVLSTPTYTVAETYKEGVTYFTEANGVYTVANITEFDEGVTYYTQSTTPIVAPIVIKDVVPNQSYENIWAVIYRDGVDQGALDEEHLAKLSFTSSNPGIAKVDSKTGVVTFVGDKGTAAITAVYEYANGKSVTDTVVFSVSPDHYYVPEDGTNDFPEYPNEGAIRFDKTATSVGNFSETGLAQVELTMTGVPYGKGVDVVVVIDTSSSMKKDKDGNDQSSYLSANARYAIMKQSLQDMLNTFAAADENGVRPDIDLAIVDFNGYSSSNSSGNSNNFIPGSNLTTSGGTTDRTGANKGRIYTGNGEGKYIMPGDSENIGGISNLGASHFENTGSNDFDSNRIAEILGYFQSGSSGTNYDFGIQAAYQLLSAKKAANEAAGVSREQYVIFLTDGAPFRYNGFTCNNQSGRAYMNELLSANYADANALQAAFTRWTMPDEVAAMYNPVSGTHPHRMAEAIKGIPEETYWAVDVTATTYKDNGVDTGSYLKPYEGLGAKFYSIGFCIADDQYNDTGVVTEATSYEVIRTLSSGAGYYWEDVESRTELSGAFNAIAKSIIDAAQDVRVEDTMGEKYTMVFDFPNNAVKEAVDNENQEFYIEVKDYVLNPVDEDNDGDVDDYVRGTYTSLFKLYLGQNADGSYYAADTSGTEFSAPVMTTNPIGNKRYWTTADNGCTTTITVSGTTYYFAEDGTGTHNIASGAYAYGTPTTETITDSGTGKSMGTNTLCNNLIIATPYFAYNAATKKLVWTAAKLSTSELAISYFLYLDRSGGYSGAENETEPGTYITNEAAYLYYRNFNGVECEQEFPVPQMTWNGAQVSYVFYLVNEEGMPVNRAGTEIPFSEAVYVTDVHTYSIIWNRLEQAAGLDAERLAKDLVPEVYELYDPAAAYRIHVYENEAYVNLNNHFVIEGKKTVNTTYVFNAKSDVEKYKAPGTYVAYNDDAPTTGKSYMCKAYDGVTVTWKEDGTIKSASYSGSKTQITPSSTTGVDYIDSNKHVYYIDDEGKVYTIVWETNGKEVREGFDFSNTTVAFAVVWKPELVEDTVVVDYGLDVVIDVTANDNTVPGVVGVRTSAPSGIEMNKGTYTASKLQTTDVKVDGTVIAKATVENKNAVRFSLDKNSGMQFTEPAVFYYEAEVTYTDDNNIQQSPDMYSKVTVIPATTVYYEDDYVILSTWTKGDAWSKDDTSQWIQVANSNKNQATDRPGEDKIGKGYDADNVYGYDEAYSECSTYSMDGYAKFTADETHYGLAEFSFYGTGFDVISLTSSDTGSITVKVYDKDNKKVGSTYFVDTYYGYVKDKDGNWVVDKTAKDNALYQIPVIKIANLPYDKYRVEVKVAYNSTLDNVAGSSSYDFYLDAIRIYDPTGNQNNTANDAYVKDNEGWPKYEEFRNLLISAEGVTTKVEKTTDENGNKIETVVVTFPEDKTLVNGAIFIDGDAKNDNIKDYVSYGPNNEVYLNAGQAVSFSVPALGNGIADVQVAMKSADGKTVNVTMTVNNKPVPAAISTATDLYYSIGSYLSKTASNTITFQNTEDSEGILSLTNLKITFENAESVKEVKNLVFTTPETAGFALRMLRTPVVEETPEPTEPEVTEPEETEPEVTEPEETEPEATEPTEPEETLDADLQVSIRNKNVKVGSTVVVMATTSRDVDALTVNGVEVTKYVESRFTGKRTWTTTVKAAEAGDMDIAVTAFSAEGRALDTVNETVTVTGKTASVVQQIIGSIIGMLFR